MPSSATSNGTRPTSVDVYGPRNRILAVLAAWVLWTATLAPSIRLLTFIPSYARVAVTISLAVALGALVYLDYGRLADAGEAWGTGQAVVTVATVVVPPYALVYLWKRGRELSQ